MADVQGWGVNSAQVLGLVGVFVLQHFPVSFENMD